MVTRPEASTATAPVKLAEARLEAVVSTADPPTVEAGVVIPVVPSKVIAMLYPHDTSQREPDDTVTLMPLLIEIGPTVWAFLVAGMV